MNLDFEAWRCPEHGEQFCPDEGCPQGFCARDNGWKPGYPSPPECTYDKRPSPAKAQSEVERLAWKVREMLAEHLTIFGDSEIEGTGAASYAIARSLPSEEQIRADERERIAKWVETPREGEKWNRPAFAAAIRALGPREQDKP